MATPTISATRLLNVAATVTKNFRSRTCPLTVELSAIGHSSNAGASWHQIFAVSTAFTSIRGSSHSASVIPGGVHQRHILISNDGSATWARRDNWIEETIGRASSLPFGKYDCGFNIRQKFPAKTLN